MRAPAMLCLLCSLLVRAHDHFGVGFFLPGRCAVFAVLCDVKYGTFFVLKAEGLHNHFFIAREMLAAGDDGKGFFARKQGFIGMCHGAEKKCSGDMSSN
jgi:hypothetical protein